MPLSTGSLLRHWKSCTRLVTYASCLCPHYMENRLRWDKTLDMENLEKLLTHMQITSVDMQSQRIHVKLKVQQEPMMDTVLRKYNKLQIHYLPINQMAKRLGMPILALTRITASLLCERGSPEKWGLYTHALIVYTVFLLKIRHLLFFGTLSLKCVLNLQISASALVLRHS